MPSGGGGGGYNIPVSVSAASTFSVPQTINAPSYVVYGSANRVGGDTEQNPSNINPATATSSAAEGNAGSSSSGSGVSGLLGGGLDSKTLLIIGGAGLAVVALIVVAIVVTRHKH